jgi:hypothetical protein
MVRRRCSSVRLDQPLPPFNPTLVAVTKPVRAIIHHVLDLDLDNWQQDIGAEATNPASKTWLQKCLTAQRALKADYLRGHPTVLRKSTKVTGDPAPKGLRVMTPDLSDMRSAPSPSC